MLNIQVLPWQLNVKHATTITHYATRADVEVPDKTAGQTLNSIR